MLYLAVHCYDMRCYLLLCYAMCDDVSLHVCVAMCSCLFAVICYIWLRIIVRCVDALNYDARYWVLQQYSSMLSVVMCCDPI